MHPGKKRPKSDDPVISYLKEHIESNGFESPLFKCLRDSRYTTPIKRPSDSSDISTPDKISPHVLYLATPDFRTLQTSEFLTARSIIQSIEELAMKRLESRVVN